MANSRSENDTRFEIPKVVCGKHEDLFEDKKDKGRKPIVISKEASRLANFASFFREFPLRKAAKVNSSANRRFR